MLSTTNKIIMKGLLIALMAVGLVVAAGSYFGVNAQDTGAACEGIALAGGNCNGAEAEGAVGGIVTTVIDILSLIVGAVSVIMIIIGGLRYVTSSGDSARVASARQTIIYAVVGLIIVIFAQVIVGFVVGRTTNTGT